MPRRLLAPYLAVSSLQTPEDGIGKTGASVKETGLGA